MFEEMTVAKMYNLNETIAKDIFEGVTYPWEVLPKISDFIVKLGETLPADEYDKVGENVWIAKSAKVFESAYIPRTGNHRKRCRGSPLRIYPWQCNCRRGSRSRKLYRT